MEWNEFIRVISITHCHVTMSSHLRIIYCPMCINMHDWMHVICSCTTLAAFTLTPINTTVCSGSTVQFVCSATEAIFVYYYLNSKRISPLPPNVNISAPTFIERATIVSMSISNASANAIITCHAYLVNETTFTRESYITVQGS